jgi:hypothetical protein
MPRKPPGVRDQVVELRVHGVSGTPPEAILDDPRPIQVSGDDIGRIFRRTSLIYDRQTSRCRAVEAYHWGRFTAGSPTRALWLLLLPFTLLNIARFALLLPHKRQTAPENQEGNNGRRERETRLPTRRFVDYSADLVLRLLGLVLTLTLVVASCFVSWGIGTILLTCSNCGGHPPWVTWYTQASPGYRILIGAMVPVAILLIVGNFGRQTFTTRTPGRTQWRTDDGSFDDVSFWYGAPSNSRQRAGHLLASSGVVGCLAVTLLDYRSMEDAKPAQWITVLYWGCLVVSGSVAALGLIVVLVDPKPSAQDLRQGGTVPLPKYWRYLLIIGGTAVLVSVAFASRQTDEMNEFRGDLTQLEFASNTLSASGAFLMILLLGSNIRMICSSEGERLLKGKAGDQSYPIVPKAFKPFWWGFGSSVLASIATLLAYGLTAATVYWAARTVGLDVNALPASYRISATLWGGLAILVALTALPLAAFLLRRNIWSIGCCVAMMAIFLAGALLNGGGVPSKLSGNALPLLLVVISGVFLACAVWLTFGDSARLLRKSSEMWNRVSGDYSAAKLDSEAPGRKALILRRWLVAGSRARYQYAVGLLAFLGGLVIAISGTLGALSVVHSLTGVNLGESASSQVESLLPRSVSELGNLVTAGIGTGFIWVGLKTWRSPSMRSNTGIVWDVLSFWPRLTHPLCPPPYGGRAVLSVATRATQLAQPVGADTKSIRPNGDSAPMGARQVAISGHSQGALICVAAVAVLDFQARPTERQRGGESNAEAPEEGWLSRERAREALPRLSLVTYGSQLQFIYARLFPTYFGYGRTRWVFDKALRQRWRTLYRWTDPLGGPGLSWPTQRPQKGTPLVGPEVSEWTDMTCDNVDCPGHKPQRERGFWVTGPDVRLIDPSNIAEDPNGALLPPMGHSDYPIDPVFDFVVATLADGLDFPVNHPICCLPQKR